MRNRFVRTSCGLLVVVVIVPTMLLLMAFATDDGTPALQRFHAAFEAYVGSDPIVGASYVVLERDRIVDWQTFGLADREPQQRVDRDTIFHWGSITKTLTAVGIMQLRDQGKLSLDDPILKYVPELTRIHTDHGPIAQVTLRHLLSHSSGFQGPTWPYRDDSKPWQPFEPTEWAQLVAMMPYQEMAFRPGSKYSYSNPAFIYLARVIESVSKESYDAYIRAHIWAPLKITHSYFNISPASLAPARSNNYTVSVGADGKDIVKTNGREFDTGITTPNGGWNAPLGDLAAWVTFLAGAAPPESRSVLSPKSLAEMWEPVVTIEGAERPAAMGLSFFLETRQIGGDTITFVGHTGSQAGFRSFFALNRQNGRAVIACFNTSRAYGATEKDASSSKADASNKGFRALRELMFEVLAAR
jgi:CubicO group peptidase (beta-lactamase class C family)